MPINQASKSATSSERITGQRFCSLVQVAAYFRCLPVPRAGVKEHGKEDNLNHEQTFGQ